MTHAVRFYDRLRGGKCRPIDPRHLGPPGSYEQMLRGLD